jgi:opacity protein-like surface antigen
MKDQGPYVRLQGGALLLNDIGFSASASAYGATVTAAGELTFDPGYSVGGSVGYAFNKFIAAEAEFGYSRVEYDKVQGTLSATVSGTTFAVSGSANVDGDISMFSGLGNLIVSPLGDSAVSPYLGAGAGFARIRDHIEKVGTLTVDGTEKSTDLIANAIAGVDFNVADNTSLGLRYRYVWADTGGKGLDDATAHSITASLKIAF